MTIGEFTKKSALRAREELYVYSQCKTCRHEERKGDESMTNQEAIRLIRNLPTMCEFTDAYGEPIDSDAYYEAVDMAISALNAQPEPSIPISWIEKQIDWLKSMGNEFSNITAMNISVLVKKWRKENGKDERSD